MKGLQCLEGRGPGSVWNVSCCFFCFQASSCYMHGAIQSRFTFWAFLGSSSQHRPCKSSRVALEHGVKISLLGTYPSPIYDSDHQGCGGHRARHHRRSGCQFQADSHKTVLTALTNAEQPVSSDKNALFAG